MENISLSEICRKCAQCCKNHPFVDLSSKEMNSLKHLTGLPLEAFTNSKGKVEEEYFLQFKKNGDCFFLNENNGEFFCGVYAARPGICKNYPSKPTQQDFCDTKCKKILDIKAG